MKTFYSVALAGALALGLATAAQAQSAAPTIPNPANPTPLNPVATDGSPLPYRGAGDNGNGLLTGRSVFAPVGAVIGTGLGVANTAVDTGFGTADTLVGGSPVR